MSKNFQLTNNLTKDTLLKLARVGLFTIAATSPYFLHSVVAQYFKDKTTELVRKRARKLRELQKRKLIDFQELDNNSIKITLSHMGQKLVRCYNLETIKLIKPERWDKMWRIIIYDIPSRQRKASNAFREKIRGLGLFPLQKSVWISPYECLPELEFISSVFEINMDKCIHYFKTSEIPREKEIREFFNL